MTEAEKLIKAGRELLDVVEKYYGESREMPIICKHEPKLGPSVVVERASVPFERYLEMVDRLNIPKCKHCGSKIKATGWEVV